MKKTPLQKSPSRRSPPYAAILMGAGLVILGIVSGLLLSDPQPNSAALQQTAPGEPLSVVPVEVNFAAPEISLTNLDGVEVALADLRGQVVLVNNWATWCPPCKAEMPTLQTYFEEHQDQGFVLVAIDAADPVGEVRQFVADYGLTFPVWLDPQNKALMAFQNQSLPSSYVIDRLGMVRLAWTGAISKSMLERYLTPLLEE